MKGNSVSSVTVLGILALVGVGGRYKAVSVQAVEPLTGTIYLCEDEQGWK